MDNLPTSVQGVDFQKEATIVGTPLINVMPVSR